MPKPTVAPRAGSSRRRKRAKAIDERSRITVHLGAPERRLPLAADPPALRAEAMRWSYLLRARRRWSVEDPERQRRGRESRQLLATFGLDDTELAAIAEAGLAEVDLPYLSEEQSWPLRLLPWEYLLAAATRELRAGRELTVVRRLRCRESLPRRRRALDSLLYVESAPAGLRDRYAFVSEREIVAAAFADAKGRVATLADPLRAELAERVERDRPAVVHLSGFDAHQGLELLAAADAESVRDGYLLRHAGEPYDLVEAGELAKLLCGAETRPLLVAFNLHHSAARLAALAVAGGAEAAIGFQDSFDDALAELFFANFYRAYRLSGGRAVEAFRLAWTTVHGQGRPLQGTGVVLWSRRSILDPPPATKSAGEAAVAPSELPARLSSELSARRVALTAENARQRLGVEVRPVRQLNYSLLHNNGPLFELLRIVKREGEGPLGAVDGLEVQVELHVGTDSYPFRMEVALEAEQPACDLAPLVRVSLTSALSRALREAVHTSLFVEVAWQGTRLYRQTHRVTLLPIDEWRDDDASRMWLPSFVLPRDAAVAAVLSAAQRYLMALADDASAGFDGYQSVIARRPQPRDCEGVDLQVRALWSALLFETPLAYINPPPTFTDASQRLRTPSEVLASRRGTCIDLALLLAACLEAIDVYPGIVLLRSHAFPAYWRHDSFLEAFRQPARPPDLGASAAEPSEASAGRLAPPVQSFSWYLERARYPEVLAEIQAGRLVPLETVFLTAHGSFAEAMAEGGRNLAGRAEFDSYLDVRLARIDPRTPVTPLPLDRREG